MFRFSAVLLFTLGSLTLRPALHGQDGGTAGDRRAVERVPGPVSNDVRVKGDEKHVLIGYGLVVGLAGTGDSDEELTQRTLNNVLQNFNVKVSEDSLKAENAAAVMLTATIRSAVHEGDEVPCTVSCIGDAESLKGGELLLTPLLGSDGESWAIAQGAVITGGFKFGDAGPGGEVQQKNHPTTGMLTGGAKMLRDVGLGIEDTDVLTLNLRQPDFSSASNLAEAINDKFLGTAVARDAATVAVRIPHEFRQQGRVPHFIGLVEQLSFVPDRPARIVFNERTGTIIIGGDVRISKVAISHGNLNINIKNIDAISEPSPFTTHDSKRIRDQSTTATEERVPLIPVPATTTVGQLVNILNNLQVAPRDMMIIFHALRKAGALHATLESM